jgi:hypothetical protein
VVQYLLGLPGVDVNRHTSDLRLADSECTALHAAVDLQDVPLVDQLLNRGANPGVARGVFQLAARKGNIAMVSRLLEAGIDIKTTRVGPGLAPRRCRLLQSEGAWTWSSFWLAGAQI